MRNSYFTPFKPLAPLSTTIASSIFILLHQQVATTPYDMRACLAGLRRSQVLVLATVNSCHCALTSIRSSALVSVLLSRAREPCLLPRSATHTIGRCECTN